MRTHTGTPVEYQQLVLRSEGRDLCPMSDNNRMLGFYSVESGMEIHIVDNDPFSLSRNGGLTDTSLIEKYRMNDEDYDKRKGTMRDFIREKRKQDPNYVLKPKTTVMDNNQGPPPGPESVEGIVVGSRCEVTPGGRRGVVKFVGEVEGLAGGGHWVGVEFDEPVGKCDGKIKDTVIFECKPGFGSFVRGKNVKTGDYPELDPFASDNEDCCDNPGGENCCDEEDDEI